MTIKFKKREQREKKLICVCGLIVHAGGAGGVCFFFLDLCHNERCVFSELNDDYANCCCSGRREKG
jgi:hypothetical protein